MSQTPSNVGIQVGIGFSPADLEAMQTQAQQAFASLQGPAFTVPVVIDPAQIQTAIQAAIEAAQASVQPIVIPVVAGPAAAVAGGADAAAIAASIMAEEGGGSPSQPVVLPDGGQVNKPIGGAGGASVADEESEFIAMAGGGTGPEAIAQARAEKAQLEADVAAVQSSSHLYSDPEIEKRLNQAQFEAPIETEVFQTQAEDSETVEMLARRNIAMQDKSLAVQARMNQIQNPQASEIASDEDAAAFTAPSLEDQESEITDGTEVGTASSAGGTLKGMYGMFKSFIVLHAALKGIGGLTEAFEANNALADAQAPEESLADIQRYKSATEESNLFYIVNPMRDARRYIASIFGGPEYQSTDDQIQSEQTFYKQQEQQEKKQARDAAEATKSLENAQEDLQYRTEGDSGHFASQRSAIQNRLKLDTSPDVDTAYKSTLPDFAQAAITDKQITDLTEQIQRDKDLSATIQDRLDHKNQGMQDPESSIMYDPHPDQAELSANQQDQASAEARLIQLQAAHAVFEDKINAAGTQRSSVINQEAQAKTFDIDAAEAEQKATEDYKLAQNKTRALGVDMQVSELGMTGGKRETAEETDRAKLRIDEIQDEINKNRELIDSYNTLKSTKENAGNTAIQADADARIKQLEAEITAMDQRIDQTKKLSAAEQAHAKDSDFSNIMEEGAHDTKAWMNFQLNAVKRDPHAEHIAHPFHPWIQMPTKRLVGDHIDRDSRDVTKALAQYQAAHPHDTDPYGEAAGIVSDHIHAEHNVMAYNDRGDKNDLFDSNDAANRFLNRDVGPHTRQTQIDPNSVDENGDPNYTKRLQDAQDAAYAGTGLKPPGTGIEPGISSYTPYIGEKSRHGSGGGMFNFIADEIRSVEKLFSGDDANTIGKAIGDAVKANMTPILVVGLGG